LKCPPLRQALTPEPPGRVWRYIRWVTLRDPKVRPLATIGTEILANNASSGRTNICYRTKNTIDRVVLLNSSTHSLRNNNIISSVLIRPGLKKKFGVRPALTDTNVYLFQHLRSLLIEEMQQFGVARCSAHSLVQCSLLRRISPYTQFYYDK